MLKKKIFVPVCKQGLTIADIDRKKILNILENEKI